MLVNDNHDMIKNRKIDPNFFEGKIFSPSIGVRVFILKLFKSIFPDFSLYFSIVGLVWDRNKLELKIKNNKTEEDHVLYLSSNKEQRCDGKFCTDNICLGIHGGVEDKVFLKFLVLFGLNMKNFSILDILKILSSDYKAKKEYYNMLFYADVSHFSIMKDWGSPIHKFRFILIEHKVLDMSYLLTFLLKEIYIYHTERECAQKIPDSSSISNRLFSFLHPDNDFLIDSYNGYFYLTSEERQKYKLEDFHHSRYEEFTDLSDDDIIMGYSNDKLEKTIENINKNIKEDKEIKVVTYSCSCVPVIIGDNFDIFKKLKEVNLPVVHEGQLQKSNYDVKLNLFYNELKKYNYKNKYIISEKTISLFGFFCDEEIKYLNKVFLLNGVKIKSIFVPIFDYKLIPFLFETELFVYTNSKRFNQVYSDTFKYFFKNKSIDLNLPFGIKNTTKWFEGIFNSFDIKYKLDVENDFFINQFYEKLHIVKSNGYRVGFNIFGLQDLNVIFSPEYSNDIDMIEFIIEMGFGIDFYITNSISEDGFSYKFDNSYNGNKELILNKISDKLRGYKDINIKFFQDSKNLYKEMKESNTSIFYSDIYFDNRLIKIGKNQFNITNFKTGYKGALDTINNLIKLSNIGYFNNINKYIKYGR